MITALIVVVGVLLGIVGLAAKQIMEENARSTNLTNEVRYWNAQAMQLQALNTDLTDERNGLVEAVNAKETQIQGMMAAAEQTKEILLTTMPGLGADWSLVVTAAKVKEELLDNQESFVKINESLARAEDQTEQVREFLRKLRRILGCTEGEDITGRARSVAKKAALFGAIADILDVPEKQMEDAPTQLLTALAIIKQGRATTDEIRATRATLAKWLGMKPGESIPQAVQRAVLEFECPKGPERTLQRIYEAVKYVPGEDIVQRLQKPVDFNVKIITRKGKVVSVFLSPQNGETWPVLGTCTFNEEER